MTASIPVSRLFNPRATAADVLQDVRSLLPALSDSQTDMAALISRTRNSKQPKPIFSVHEESSTTWPFGHPDTDVWWDKKVRGEPILRPASIPHWLDMDESKLDKPLGSFKTKLFVLSSYLADHTTMHQRYGRVNDLSTVCMSTLYKKAGLGQMGRQSDMLHLDIFPRRLNRNEMLPARRVFSLVPSALLQYSENVAVNAIELLEASVILNMGEYAARVYAKSLVARRLRYRVIPTTLRLKKSTVRGWFEFATVDGSEVLSRIVLNAPHPEAFVRDRGYDINKVCRAIATQERLIDYAMVIVYSQPNMLAYLSTMAYFRDRVSVTAGAV
jgi:hypothetical protein